MPLRALATVDLAAVRRNAARLAERAPEAILCAVVKADGYGHGAVPVAQAAVQGGAGWLAVATAQEAAALRAGGIGERILVMGALSAAELPVALEAGADIVVWSAELLDAALRSPAQRPLRLHVKVDTGMGRLGTRDAGLALELARRVAAAPGAGLAGLMTHFATADDDREFMATQLRAFADLLAAARELAPELIAHAANSAATLREPAAHLDMVRCGIGLYGCDPMHHDPGDWDLEPALSLQSYVAAVKAVAPGQSAGYGRRFVAREPTFLATLPIGYGDGVRRGLTNNCDVLIGGRRYPLVGTVSMDNITLDVGPEPRVAVGEMATLIGRDGEERITAEEVAGRLGTINYEVLCGISARVPRRYVGEA